ncbi:ribonuclease III [Candidatus Woesebacteria bacterium RBG_19FT_COMBO_42_9]|uniref:Ribonuclease 3 n=1 Tax=Candidatus Woesebacteria bacterium RBG_16_42_24 TaxID=1802485 RepID=A0A1F7XK21_9BACT|nr:MAG: ribonuclease III [Candidatus Woesebacteria bacterium RBG_16_42_24]OGM16357.1 MAG: ribonuclease III [Candidatus Woesebacteria bacterium RBG_19FT_COMBO_42_9]OGM67406.1 MAG: ribonuclease III [Candidatus Woesebacteria bacterium RIFCSPLOWO2_01_FULL_43_11]
MKNLDELSSLFANRELLTQALTHRSWVNENPKVRGSNERLEFLGDAILEFLVSKEIYERYPDKPEGYLTALRANLVNTQNLAGIAEKLKVGAKLYLSKGEEEGGGRENSSLLADTVEAIIGALYIDQGVIKVYQFLKLHLFSQISEKAKHDLKDAKSRLQELIQAKGKPAPRYVVTHESGPDHAKSFIVEVVVENQALASGQGKNKSEAEQKAAEMALKSLL